jgi:hypothetical protein
MSPTIRGKLGKIGMYGGCAFVLYTLFLIVLGLLALKVSILRTFLMMEHVNLLLVLAMISFLSIPCFILSMMGFRRIREIGVYTNIFSFLSALLIFWIAE